MKDSKACAGISS